MKKLVSIAVVLALLAAFVVPATVGAWDISDPNPANWDKSVSVTTPGGFLVGKLMTLTEFLLDKYITSSYCLNCTTVETWNPMTQTWSEVPANAITITGISAMGETLIASLGDIIGWSLAVVADVMRMMAGA